MNDSTEKVLDSRKKRLAAIRGVQLQNARSVLACNLRRLLEQLEICSSDYQLGSAIRLSTLAERLGRSVRTVQRYLTAASEWGLVVITRKRILGDWESNIKVCWSRVLELCGGDVPKTQLFLSLEHDATRQSVACTNDKMSRAHNKDIGPRGLDPRKRPPLTPPLPTPRPSPKPAPKPADPQGREWGELRDKLESLGVCVAGGAIDAMRRSGVEPWAASAVVRFYEAHRGAWGAGALYRRLCSLRPSHVPEAASPADLEAVLECWPKPKKPIRSRAVRALKPALESKDQLRHRRACEDAQRLAELPAWVTSFYDQMSHQERLTLVSDHGGEFALKSASRDPETLRYLCLTYLAERPACEGATV